MTAIEFLRLLLPSSGVIFTATPGEKGWYNTAHTSVDQAVAHVNQLTFEGSPAYFALATYEKAKYWDAAEEKWRRRTQENAILLKSFFLDLDVGEDDSKKFASKQEAVAALKDFTQQVGLPRPMLVDSGGGIHAYWPLAHEVATAEWRPVADRLKAICIALKLRADMSVPADQARVLRCLGSFNVRRNHSVQLICKTTPVSFVDFAQRVNAYADQMSIPLVAPKAHHSAAPAAVDALWGEGNLGATNDPGHFDRIVFSCEQLGQQVAVRGAGVGEQLWRAGLAVAKFCDHTAEAALALSDAHAEFNPDEMQSKMDNWHAGPATCAHFHQLNPATCEACPHWQKITSPIQLGRQVETAPAPVVAVAAVPGVETAAFVVPEPPTGYKRRKDGSIVIESEDADGKINYTVVCPIDLYPISIDRQNGSDCKVSERSWWRAHLPDGPDKTRTDDFEVESKLLANARELFAFLLGRGIYMSDDQGKATGRYMSAYLRKIAGEAGRNQLFERLGWQEDHKAFVLGAQVLYASGTVAAHKTPPVIRNITNDKMGTSGDLASWQQAMEFYNRPGYEAQRFFIYCALGAPLFHMVGTAAKGALVLATGRSGRGKTMILKACSSIWGHPEALVINGNKAGATTNALYGALGTVHSLPFLWDDITQRDPDELRDFMLNVSQGRGKLRLGTNSAINDQVQTWETIVMASANTDVAALMAGGGKDADAHQRRLFTVEFDLPDTSATAKAKADAFMATLQHHHGHVGMAFMRSIITNYAAVQVEIQKNLAKIDLALAAPDAAAARYWTAVVAAAYTGGKIAAALGLIKYPVKADLDWMIDMIRYQCELVEDTRSDAAEVLTKFLNENLRQTLTISAKSASNLDNIDKEPIDKLVVRVEQDVNLIYIEVNAVKKYFLDNSRSYTADRRTLMASGVVLDDRSRRCIGSGTRYGSNGAVRCWKIDALKLAGAVGQQTTPPPAASNVTPMRKKA